MPTNPPPASKLSEWIGLLNSDSPLDSEIRKEIARGLEAFLPAFSDVRHSEGFIFLFLLMGFLFSGELIA